MTQKTVAELAAYILSERQIEKEAATRRKIAEASLLDLMDKKDEGTVSLKEDGFKISATFKVTRKVDEEGVTNDWSGLSVLIQDAFKWSPSLDLKHARAIEEANPEQYKILAKYLTVTPATPTIKIEEA